MKCRKKVVRAEIEVEEAYCERQYEKKEEKGDLIGADKGSPLQRLCSIQHNTSSLLLAR